MNWKRLLGAEEGWGSAVGLLLLLGFGLFILFVSVADLREAARTAPVERACAEWLADPSGARWVKLTGCKLDLGAAATRRWKGFVSVADGGVSGQRFLELFVPIGVDVTSNDAPRAVLATTDKALLDQVNAIDRLPKEAVGPYLDEHRAELEALISPELLTGYVEPVKSLAARSALGTLDAAEGAVVLEQNRQPPRANAVFGVLMGLAFVALAVRTVARRLLVDRDSSL